MKHTLNNISHFDFFEGLERIYSEAEKLSVANIQVATEFQAEVDSVIRKTQEYIGKYIMPDAERIIKLIDTNFDPVFDGFAYGDLLSKQADLIEHAGKLYKFKNSLREVIGYLSMINSLLHPNEHILIESISDKTDFVLSKLNSVYGNEMYLIGQILELNNIRTREGEGREIALDLHKRGYVNLKEAWGGGYSLVNISVKGARYIERKLKMSSMAKEKNELNDKIDVVLAQLTKLGYGQEVIFNEIEELRELQHKLSKKSWSQLLKGKLVDLTLDKLVTVDVAKLVYEYLTSNNFKLLP
jgi:hypothetical protein